MRKAREYSSTGLYHIVVRGVNKQNIFFDKFDRMFFLLLIKKYKKKYQIIIHAYCLMDNHIHLLVEDPRHHISDFMQAINSLYARYFNRKYDRIGHLFQNRFLSEVILNSSYYQTVFRYILQNPQRAKICSMENYKWSSFKFYKMKNSLIHREKASLYFENINQLYDFINQTTDDECIDIELRPSEKEKYNIEKIKKLLNSKTTLIQPDLPMHLILEKIRILKKANLSIRTISRLTGIMNWLVFKA